MSWAHKNSQLALEDMLIAVPDGAAYFPFDQHIASTQLIYPEGYDNHTVTDYGLYTGMNLCATLRPDEGKFGGAVAIEEGTTNVFVSPYTMDSTHWTTYGVNDNTSHTRVTDSEENIYGGSSIKVERIAPNSVLSTTTTHITKPARIVLSPGGSATFSVFVKGSSGVLGKPLFLWFYGNRSTGGTFSTGGYAGVITSDWQKYGVTVTNTTTDQNWTITNVYCRSDVGSDLPNGEYFLIHLPQLEQKPFATSFVDGSRGNGVILYDIPINPAEYTLGAWMKLTGTGFEERQNLILITSSNSSTQDDRMGFKIYNNQFEFWNDIGSGGYTSTDVSITDMDWHYFVQVFKLDDGIATTYNYFDGSFIGSNAQADGWLNHPDTIGLGKADNHLTSNYLVDELLILPYAAKDEEIKAWYHSQRPLYDPQRLDHIVG